MNYELIERCEIELDPCKYIDVVPSEMVDRFGEPTPVDVHYSSGGYLFEDDKGQIFSIHENKNTTVVDPSKLLPEHLWEYDQPVEFCVCKENDAELIDVDSFIKFICD